MAKLQGRWKLVRAQYNGIETDHSDSEHPPVMQFRNATMISPLGVQRNYRLNGQSDPKEIDVYDLQTKEVSEVGIYRIDGKQLTMCRCPRRCGRPREFLTEYDDRRTLQVFQRVE